MGLYDGVEGGAFAWSLIPRNFSTLPTTPADMASTVFDIEFAKDSTLAVVLFVGACFPGSPAEGCPCPWPQ